ncbi:MAG TPA: hypothetical protein VFS67_21435 [Polyangiaceae bacterium]|nr:hypothetical protein [Polyangiaceae bacterium]
MFGVVSRRLHEHTGEGSLRTWLFAIVQRVAANHRRTQRRKQQPLEPLSPAARAAGPSPEAQAEAAQAASIVQRFCDGPPRPAQPADFDFEAPSDTPAVTGWAHSAALAREHAVDPAHAPHARQPGAFPRPQREPHPSDTAPARGSNEELALLARAERALRADNSAVLALPGVHDGRRRCRRYGAGTDR